MENDYIVPLRDNKLRVNGINPRIMGKTGVLPLKLSQCYCLIILFFLEIQG